MWVGVAHLCMCVVEGWGRVDRSFHAGSGCGGWVGWRVTCEPGFRGGVGREGEPDAAADARFIGGITTTQRCEWASCACGIDAPRSACKQAPAIPEPKVAFHSRAADLDMVGIAIERHRQAERREQGQEDREGQRGREGGIGVRRVPRRQRGERRVRHFAWAA